MLIASPPPPSSSLSHPHPTPHSLLKPSSIPSMPHSPPMCIPPVLPPFSPPCVFPRSFPHSLPPHVYSLGPSPIPSTILPPPHMCSPPVLTALRKLPAFSTMCMMSLSPVFSSRSTTNNMDTVNIRHQPGESP